MHVHQSIWKEGVLPFGGDGYAGLSEMALHYIGGITKHAKSIAALTNLTTNRTAACRASAPRNSRTRRAIDRRACAFRSPARRQRRAASRSASRPELQPVPRVQRDADGRLDGIQNKIDP